MVFVKVLFSQLSDASRDRRELQTVMGLGVKAIALAKAENDGVSPGVEGVELHNPTTRPLGEKCPNVINRIVSLFTWAKQARSYRPDVISGHDLPGLTAAWIATWFTRSSKRPLLVYDAHEFEVGRSQRSKLATAFVSRYERFLMNRCEFSIMVNDPIADEVVRIHRLKKRPVVARNIPVYWHLDDQVTAQTRESLCSQLNCDKDTFLVMYHGMIFPVRGIETVIQSISITQGTAAVILGKGKDEYIEQLHKMCEELGVADRVLILPAVHNSELWKYTSAVDVGVSPVLPLVQNSLFMLPNKLFENVQSLTPVIVSNMPVQTQIVEKHGVGLSFEVGNAQSLAEAINRIKDDPRFREELQENLRAAKEELCWEKEKTKLEQAYAAAFAKRGSRKK